MADITSSVRFRHSQKAVDYCAEWHFTEVIIPAGLITATNHDVVLPDRFDSGVFCLGAVIQTTQLGAQTSGTCVANLEVTPITKSTGAVGSLTDLGIAADVKTYTLDSYDSTAAAATIGAVTATVTDATQWWGFNLEVTAATNAITSDVGILVGALLMRNSEASYGTGAES